MSFSNTINPPLSNFSFFNLMNFFFSNYSSQVPCHMDHWKGKRYLEFFCPAAVILSQWFMHPHAALKLRGWCYVKGNVNASRVLCPNDSQFSARLEICSEPDHSESQCCSNLSSGYSECTKNWVLVRALGAPNWGHCAPVPAVRTHPLCVLHGHQWISECVPNESLSLDYYCLSLFSSVLHREQVALVLPFELREYLPQVIKRIWKLRIMPVQ